MKIGMVPAPLPRTSTKVGTGPFDDLRFVFERPLHGLQFAEKLLVASQKIADWGRCPVSAMRHVLNKRESALYLCLKVLIPKYKEKADTIVTVSWNCPHANRKAFFLGQASPQASGPVFLWPSGSGWKIAYRAQNAFFLKIINICPDAQPQDGLSPACVRLSL